MIRKAAIADLPALCSLLGILFSQEAEFSPDMEKQARALRQIVSNPETGLILLCAEQGETVAMTSLLFTVSTAMGGRAAILEDLVVHPSCRGRGLGTKLLQAAIGQAKESGCLRITLLTDRDNERAIELYRKHGFTPSPMLPLRLALV
ncbi:MAG: GNAT family N-acetyltransferase [Burkholderiales bacterium]|nr:GNAT family N-acetyltransferase [Burkholderiales bacterium]